MVLNTETELKIVASAEKLFYQKGKAGTSMQDIADDAGINRTLLNYYFRSKHQLFEGQIIDMGAEDMFGTSIFIDWCDTSIRTTTTNEDKTDVVMTFEKARHADEEIKPINIKVMMVILVCRTLKHGKQYTPELTIFHFPLTMIFIFYVVIRF